MPSKPNDVANLLPFLTPSQDPGSLGRLAGLEILEIIGRGSMGIVCKAHDTRIQRIVAVKVMAPEVMRDPAAGQRFFREARATAFF